MCASKIMQDAEVARQQGNEHFKASCKFLQLLKPPPNFLEQIDHQAGRVPEALAHYVPWFATLSERGYWLDVEICATFFHRKRAWSYWRYNLKCLPAVLPHCWAMLSLGHFHGCWETSLIGRYLVKMMIHVLLAGGHRNPSSAIESSQAAFDLNIIPWFFQADYTHL